tara:strand:- start:1004 stop:1207 length:204 start_codon:yes stop_codon:yes gene_type:complete
VHPIKDREANENPIRKEPLSPIKIFAGWELRDRKPPQLPAKIADKMAIKILLLLFNAIIPIPKNEID